MVELAGATTEVIWTYSEAVQDMCEEAIAAIEVVEPVAFTAAVEEVETSAIAELIATAAGVLAT